jgi:hypothetical protein
MVVVVVLVVVVVVVVLSVVLLVVVVVDVVVVDDVATVVVVVVPGALTQNASENSVHDPTSSARSSKTVAVHVPVTLVPSTYVAKATSGRKLSVNGAALPLTATAAESRKTVFT